MEDIVTRLRRAVDNEPFMLGGEHDLLKDALREITTLLGCCDGAAAQDAHVRREREEHRAEVELLHNDAMRYRWLRKQKALRLVSDGAIWKRENGENFRASHALSANDTRYGVYETLDETIDEAMRGESP